MDPCSHWLLAETTVRLQLNQVDCSFYSLAGLGRDIFLPQVHLKDPPAISPHCYPIQQTPLLQQALSVPSALKPKANCKVSIQILKSFKLFSRLFFFPHSGSCFKTQEKLLTVFRYEKCHSKSCKIMPPFPVFRVHNATIPSPSQSQLFFSHTVRWS